MTQKKSDDRVIGVNSSRAEFVKRMRSLIDEYEGMPEGDEGFICLVHIIQTGESINEETPSRIRLQHNGSTFHEGLIIVNNLTADLFETTEDSDVSNLHTVQ